LTSDEHIHEAERFLEESKQAPSIGEARVLIDMAHVHATLAVARSSQDGTMATIYGGK
jgi:hypothetical protein